MDCLKRGWSSLVLMLTDHPVTAAVWLIQHFPRVGYMILTLMIIEVDLIQHTVKLSAVGCIVQLNMMPCENKCNNDTCQRNSFLSSLPDNFNEK